MPRGAGRLPFCLAAYALGVALAARRSRALPVNVVGSWSVAVGVEFVVAVGAAEFSFVNIRALGGK